MVKGAGSKSHPCHSCGHAANASASVPLHHNHHHHHQHHHNHHHLKNQVEANQNTSDTKILAPLRSKMRVLKKLKRKMGLGEPICQFFLLQVFYCMLCFLPDHGKYFRVSAQTSDLLQIAIYCRVSSSRLAISCRYCIIAGTIVPGCVQSFKGVRIVICGVRMN